MTANGSRALKEAEWRCQNKDPMKSADFDETALSRINCEKPPNAGVKSRRKLWTMCGIHAAKQESGAVLSMSIKASRSLMNPCTRSINAARCVQMYLPYG